MPTRSNPPTNVAAIADRLQRTRVALDLSQAELCRRAGLAPNRYNQWERGAGRPDLDGALKLCAAFGLTLDWIYRGDPSGLPHKLALALSTAAA